MKARFSQFLYLPERITTNVLTDRLSVIERACLVQKAAYQLHPKRFEYTLTLKGEALLPLLQEMCRWANRFVPGTWTAPETFITRRAPDPQ